LVADKSAGLWLIVDALLSAKVEGENDLSIYGEIPPARAKTARKMVGIPPNSEIAGLYFSRYLVWTSGLIFIEEGICTWDEPSNGGRVVVFLQYDQIHAAELDDSGSKKLLKRLGINAPKSIEATILQAIREIKRRLDKFEQDSPVAIRLGGGLAQRLPK
jgi:hypothetical protein